MLNFSESSLDVRGEVLSVLDEGLSLRGRAKGFDLDTPLLGALPELDSMAVLAVIHLLEERFGFVDDEQRIDGSTFATVGSLVDFVRSRIG